MLESQLFATLALGAASAAIKRPEPSSDGEAYLLALLDSQEALDVALDALIARAAQADSRETAYIQLQKGNVQADYLKLDAMVNAYLSRRTIFKAVSETDLETIRAILDRMQGFTAKKEKATEIMKAVTELLTRWSPASAHN